MRAFKIASLTLLAFLLFPWPALADGIIIPFPPKPPIPPISALEIKYHRVNVSIKDQVAFTRVDQVFYNPNSFPIEGIYVFPFPEEAAISAFSMYVDGKKLEGKLLKKEEARRLYEQIVRSSKDPALLEYVGRNAFQASIFPIPPGGERRIQVEYTQLLPYEGGIVKYIYPLDTERFSAKPIEEVTINIEISSQKPLKLIYSSSHEVRIERQGENKAVVGYEEKNTLPDRDFALYFSFSPDELGFGLLSYKPAGEDGFFILFLSPEIRQEEEVAKDVIFVLDISGSMEGEKLRQAKEALKFVLSRLHGEDRFNVLVFSTGVYRFAESLVPASEKEKAREFVEELQAGGSTNIYQALLEALADVEERPTYLLFLTDGLPTVGITDVHRIVEEVSRKIPRNVRLFTFGVGDDVNTFLLDKLASEHRGISTYVRPGEDLEAAISTFYSRISSPVLTDLSLEFKGVRVRDLYPSPLPDLFAGSQLVIVGRYQEGGKATVTIKGKRGDKEETLSWETEFLTKGGEEFIPRIWAARHIGYLMEQIRLHGENKEIVDEIVELSLRYGIITPYTSFLVGEEIFTPEGKEEAVRKLMPNLSMAPEASFGAQAVQKSIVQRHLQETTLATPSIVSERIRQIGDRAFIFRDGVWIDTTFERKKMETIRVPFGSEAYFRLLMENPQLGRYFSLGKRVIVVAGDRTYEVVEEPEKPSPPPQKPDFLTRLIRLLRNILKLKN
ncbi:MAG: VIT domain-containing protein [Anaerolineae bacterium]|nr:VIT domain-containing protein [Anaerolineae bacterium]